MLQSGPSRGAGRGDPEARRYSQWLSREIRTPTTPASFAASPSNYCPSGARAAGRPPWSRCCRRCFVPAVFCIAVATRLWE